MRSAPKDQPLRPDDEDYKNLVVIDSMNQPSETALRQRRTDAVRWT